MDNYNKLFMIIRKTDLLNFDEKCELKLYLMNLQEQVKKQKEVIDKAIKYIKKNRKEISKYQAEGTNLPLKSFMWDIDIVLNILNEVSE
ncbi:MAG: hypothetical protein Q4C38_04585 [bacterium]|nr:hypothetical protein [bacterium]